MANVLIWDVERTTLDVLDRVYDLRIKKSRHDPKQIVRDWNLLGAAWKTRDGPISCISVSPKDPFNDYEVVRRLHEVLSAADVLIGHNSDAFDLKTFNARAIFWGFTPIPPKVSIDTLKVAKKYFKFTSNKLSYIAQYLGVALKDESPDWDLILAGDAEELANMREYNKKDVIVTEQVYQKLMGWHHTHPQISDVKDIEGADVHVCPKCSSPRLQRRGTRRMASGKQLQQYQCNNCGGYHSRKS